jgi:MarR family transcriptional regulator for hemolysin
MTDRFSGSLLRNDARDEELPPSLGEMGLNGFAPYLMNRVMARWNTNVAEELKDLEMTTARCVRWPSSAFPRRSPSTSFRLLPSP